MNHQVHDSQIADYIDLTFDTFLELRGDRKSGDDRAVIGGLARLNDHKVIIIGYESDGSVETPRAFGSEGYRKCSRLIRLAEAFNKPVIVFIGIPTVTFFPESGQPWVDEAIARSLEEMSCLMTPIIGIITEESSAATAIGMCAADRVLMLEDANRSISLPNETSVSGADTVPLYLRTQDLLNLDVVHRMVKGSPQGDLESAASALREVISEELFQLRQVNLQVLVQQRLHKLQHQFLNFTTSQLSSDNLDNTV